MNFFKKLSNNIRQFVKKIFQPTPKKLKVDSKITDFQEEAEKVQREENKRLLEAQQAEITKQQAEIKRQQAEIEKLRAQVKAKEQEIKALNASIDKLTKQESKIEAARIGGAKEYIINVFELAADYNKDIGSATVRSMIDDISKMTIDEIELLIADNVVAKVCDCYDKYIETQSEGWAYQAGVEFVAVVANWKTLFNYYHKEETLFSVMEDEEELPF